MNGIFNYSITVQTTEKLLLEFGEGSARLSRISHNTPRKVGRKKQPDQVLKLCLHLHTVRDNVTVK